MRYYNDRKVTATTPKVDADAPEIDRLTALIDRQMQMIAAYKARQDDIVLALGKVLKSEDIGVHAKEAIDDLLARDLKQAKARVYDRTFALDIAVRAMLKVQAGPSAGAFQAELDQIRKLAPEAFAE